ncbi:hypothetical protein GCM10010123_00060 [Pilimelia anulata]|uniref:Secreted protein n=1 Tax=Pilimelia anulata TaxID=53371 RepID=A0A8J3F5M9_9ACTN|nr:DUF4360 domain-containing protein [Pilimelia anulata]GGJ74110.1 hypothetical protein GCM10010123_00060 [Pilimelia anulata]
MTRRIPRGPVVVAAAVAGVLVAGYGTASALTDDAAAAPTVKLLAANGDGCVDGRGVTVSNAAKPGVFTIHITGAGSAVGPDVPASQRRKTCTVSLDVNTSRGSTYAIRKVTLNGSARLARGASGTATVVAAAKAGADGTFSHKENGPLRDYWTDSGVPEPAVEGECGSDRALTVAASTFTNRGSSGTDATSSFNLIGPRRHQSLVVQLAQVDC